MYEDFYFYEKIFLLEEEIENIIDNYFDFLERNLKSGYFDCRIKSIVGKNINILERELTRLSKTAPEKKFVENKFAKKYRHKKIKTYNLYYYKDFIKDNKNQIKKLIQVLGFIPEEVISFLDKDIRIDKNNNLYFVEPYNLKWKYITEKK